MHDTSHQCRISNRAARAACPNQLSLLERMISDSGRQPVRRRTSAFVSMAVVDAEDASLTPLVKCVHLSSHCLRQCPRLGYIQKDWQDIHGVETNLGGHRYAGAPDIAIQRGHAIPRNCYPSHQLCLAPSISVLTHSEY